MNDQNNQPPDNHETHFSAERDVSAENINVGGTQNVTTTHTTSTTFINRVPRWVIAILLVAALIGVAFVFRGDLYRIVQMNIGLRLFGEPFAADVTGVVLADFADFGGEPAARVL